MTPNSTNHLKKIFETLDQSKDHDVRLYLISRRPKPGAASRASTLEKHLYEAYQVELSPELQGYIRTAILQQLENVIQADGFEVVEYDLLGNDDAQVSQYRIKNTTMPFVDLIHNQLSGDVEIPKLNNLGTIQKSLWAYCIGIRTNDDRMIYTFRKASKSKVAVEEDNNPEVLYLTRKFRTVFNMDQSRLEALHEQTMVIDGRIDCLYLDEHFYVLQKTAFETIVGLAEEFLSVANDLLDELEASELIEGLKLVRDEVKSGVSLVRKLAGIAKSEDLRRIDRQRLTAMQATAKKFELTLRVKNDRIVIESKEDIDLLIKLLADYYVLSEQTGTHYGTYAKRRLTSGRSSS